METKRGVFWETFYRESGIPVPERDTWGTRFGLIIGASTLWLPRPIRRVIRWPLEVMAFLFWALVITPIEAIGRLVKRFANRS